MSSPKIFVSYRRDDTSGYTGRLCDALTDRFGRDHVFFDIDTLQPELTSPCGPPADSDQQEMT